jgi:hypothetical protein
VLAFVPIAPSLCRGQIWRPGWEQVQEGPSPWPPFSSSHCLPEQRRYAPPIALGYFCPEWTQGGGVFLPRMAQGG